MKDKKLLNLEVFLGFVSVIVLLICIYVYSFVNVDNIYKILILVFGFIVCIIGFCYCLKIEQIAGFYECKKCHHKYVPTYLSVFLAFHIFRIRYMRCPKCGKKSWNRKVLSRVDVND